MKEKIKEHYENFVSGWKLINCLACSGSGHYKDGKCGACNGTGKERLNPRIKNDSTT